MFWQFLIDIDVFINAGQCQDPADPLVDPHSQHRASGKPDIFIPAHDHSDTGAVHKTYLRKKGINYSRVTGKSGISVSKTIYHMGEDGKEFKLSEKRREAEN